MKIQRLEAKKWRKLEKEHHLNQSTIFWVQHVNFPGCNARFGGFHLLVGGPLGPAVEKLGEEELLDEKWTIKLMKNFEEAGGFYL